MSLSKISLFLAIFLLSFTIHNQITAMETIEQSIQKKLLRLDKAILATAFEVRNSKQSLMTAQQSYREYLEDDNNEIWCCGISDNALLTEKNNYEKCKTLYDMLLKIQQRQEEIFVFFKTNFKRGKRLKDLDYLENMEIDLTNYLNNLSDPSHLKWSIK